jgi:hypothetical protein
MAGLPEDPLGTEPDHTLRSATVLFVTSRTARGNRAVARPLKDDPQKALFVFRIRYTLDTTQLILKEMT